MAPPSQAKIAEWKRKEEAIPRQGLDVFERADAFEASLGDDYKAYNEWNLQNIRQEIAERSRVIPGSEFCQRVESINWNSNQSLDEFEWFLQRPKVQHIVLGQMGSRLLKLAPEGSHLEQDPLERKESDDDDPRPRLMMAGTLGLWDDVRKYRQGQKSDEGYASGGSISGTSGLEVFQQLGLIYSCDKKRPLNLYAGDGWHFSNYVLVLNAHDDSLWVLWRKYMRDPETAELVPTKGNWEPHRRHYAAFPGDDENAGDIGPRVVFYAKLADSCAALNPGNETIQRLQRVHGGKVSGKAPEEPVLVSVVRTEQGGLRRQNDYRSMGTRQ